MREARLCFQRADFAALELAYRVVEGLPGPRHFEPDQVAANSIVTVKAALNMAVDRIETLAGFDFAFQPWLDRNVSVRSEPSFGL